MKSKLLILGLCLGAGLIWITRPSGYQETHITDFSKPVSLSVEAPWLPFRSGEMYVVVEGDLTGKGELLVYENNVEEPHRISVFGPTVFYIFGGAENWSEQVTVTLLPGGIKSGGLDLRVYCGAYPKPIKRKPEQGVDPNRSTALLLNSRSSVRGADD